MNNNVDLFPIFTLLPMAVVVALVFWVNSEMRKLRESFQQQSPVIKPDTKGLETVMKQLRLMADDQANSETLKKTNLDVAGVLSSQDRIQLARLVVLMGILDEKVNVAAIHAESVAEDLAASHLRANETEGPSGAAADAAFKTNSSI